jgi:hypothetical protein
MAHNSKKSNARRNNSRKSNRRRNNSNEESLSDSNVPRDIDTDRQNLIQKIPGWIESLSTSIDIYASSNNTRFPSATLVFFQNLNTPDIKKVTAEILSQEASFVNLLKNFQEFLTVSLSTPDQVISETSSKMFFQHYTSLSLATSDLAKHFKTLCEISVKAASGPYAIHHTKIRELNSMYYTLCLIVLICQ